MIPQARWWIISIFILSTTAPLCADESWTTLDGDRFKGDPAGMVGPFAIFRINGNQGRNILLSQLSEDECRRLYRKIEGLPQRQDTWEDAGGEISREVVGRLLSAVDGERMQPFDFSGRPEPDYFVVVYGDMSDWRFLKAFRRPYRQLKSALGDTVEGIFFASGKKASASRHEEFSLQQRIDLLVTDYTQQGRMDDLAAMAPGDGPLLVIVNRHGAPLFSTTSEDEIESTFARFQKFLDLNDPGLPANWKHCAHYMRATQTLRFARASAGPVLMGSPVDHRQLATLGVGAFSLTIELDAAHKVTGLNLDPDGPMPSEVVLEGISVAFSRIAVYVSAVENGRFVAGSLVYRFEP
jgi:hypothetical protein